MVTYHKRFKNIIDENYGTIREFAAQNKVSYPTAMKYMRCPDSMTIGFARSLSERINVSLIKIIGEGEE
jgi:hypothetical protein